MSNKEGLPPFIKSWKQFYLLIVVWLVFLILIFSLITSIYS
ncbi:hypothetical protein [Desertivirga xinjiangensis]|nr:hypothetical protein [Pedobacter xinjiangensis]